MYRNKLLLLFILVSLELFSQKKRKVLLIQHAKNPPLIDAVLNDVVWENASIAEGFTMYKPGYGDQEPEKQKTEVKLAYDDEAIYIAAYLRVPNNYTIPQQFTTRDSFGQSDTFSVAINPYNDGINDFVFHVMSSGTQADAKISMDGGDFSWNAIWESKVLVYKDRWVVEMKIPYAALRFSNKKIQEWGINFYRSNILKKEKYSWNFIDKEKGKHSEYAGLLKGIKNIHPPLRLSFYPFAQGSLNLNQGDIDWNGTAGLDLKYGIDESFTLDATLIPDFGQTEFDDLVLNLGPFEQQYEEKRAFFTEGTELFTKGDLLYSRRIGDEPLLYDEVEEDLKLDEVLIKNPEKSRILNAIKISGRRDSYGMGVFNAVTAKTTAIILDTIKNKERRFISNPFSNYNVLVFDKNFQKNSSISLVNTNVYRRGYFSNANVTAAILDYKTRDNKYAIKTNVSMSHTTDAKTGYQSFLSFREVAGAHRFGFSLDFNDANYDKTDLGFQEYSNYLVYEASYSFRTFKPVGVFNSIRMGGWANVEYKFQPYLYTDNSTGLYIRFKTKKYFTYGGNLNYSFGNKIDFYEPHAENRFYKKRQMQYLNAFFYTNHSNPFSTLISVTYGEQFQIIKPEKSISFHFKPRYRFNDRFQITYSLLSKKIINKKGYVMKDQEDILFGNRNGKVLVNSLQAKYHVSIKSAFGLTFRHYWSQADYDDKLYYLENDGSLSFDSRTENFDKNVNYWNLDLNYSWEFAPGSQLIAQYRNKIINNNDRTEINLLDNIDELFEEPINHTLSLKLIYYIDYNKLKF